MGNRKSRRFMGLVFGKSSREKRGEVRIPPVSSRMLAAMPQLLLIIRNLDKKEP